jgi:hypothetical protein
VRALLNLRSQPPSKTGSAYIFWKVRAMRRSGGRLLHCLADRASPDAEYEADGRVTSGNWVCRPWCGQSAVQNCIIRNFTLRCDEVMGLLARGCERERRFLGAEEEQLLTRGQNCRRKAENRIVGEQRTETRIDGYVICGIESFETVPFLELPMCSGGCMGGQQEARGVNLRR